MLIAILPPLETLPRVLPVCRLRIGRDIPVLSPHAYVQPQGDNVPGSPRLGRPREIKPGGGTRYAGAIQFSLFLYSGAAAAAAGLSSFFNSSGFHCAALFQPVVYGFAETFGLYRGTGPFTLTQSFTCFLFLFSVFYFVSLKLFFISQTFLFFCKIYLFIRCYLFN